MVAINLTVRWQFRRDLMRVAASVDEAERDLSLLARVLSGRVMGEGPPMVHVRKSGTHY